METDFKIKTIEVRNKKIKLIIWDSPGPVLNRTFEGTKGIASYDDLQKK